MNETNMTQEPDNGTQQREFMGWDCQTCGEETAHAILREREGRLVLQCEECQKVQKVTRAQERPLQVPLVISDMEASYKEELELYEEEQVTVGDQIFHGEHNLLITAIEALPSQDPERSGDTKTQPQRVATAQAIHIKRMWAKLYDRVRVGVAINRGHTTTSAHLWCTPEEELFVGDELEVGGEKVVVISFKTEHSMRREGQAPAAEVRRLYCRPLKGQRSRGQFKSQKRHSRR